MDLLAIDNLPDLIAARMAAIHEAMLRESRCIRQGNFERIDREDLQRLFELYDAQFFGGFLGREVVAKTKTSLRFRLSSTMTRSGGKTSRYRRRVRGGVRAEYEIAVASRMLFMNFRDVARPVMVGGLACEDRLQALQRIMEHEILHLAEMLVWDESSCSGVRFRVMARRIFGHTDKTHALVTPREHAAARHGIRVGSMVEFELSGRRLAGRVNRVHQRATVLVESAAGMRYSDGKSYEKFYVPLPRLTLQPIIGCQH